MQQPDYLVLLETAMFSQNNAQRRNAEHEVYVWGLKNSESVECLLDLLVNPLQPDSLKLSGAIFLPKLIDKLIHTPEYSQNDKMINHAQQMVQSLNDPQLPTKYQDYIRAALQKLKLFNGENFDKKLSATVCLQQNCINLLKNAKDVIDVQAGIQIFRFISDNLLKEKSFEYVPFFIDKGSWLIEQCQLISIPNSQQEIQMEQDLAPSKKDLKMMTLRYYDVIKSWAEIADEFVFRAFKGKTQLLKELARFVQDSPVFQASLIKVIMYRPAPDTFLISSKTKYRDTLLNSGRGHALSVLNKVQSRNIEPFFPNEASLILKDIIIALQQFTAQFQLSRSLSAINLQLLLSEMFKYISYSLEISSETEIIQQHRLTIILDVILPCLVTTTKELQNDSEEAIPQLLDLIYYQKSDTPKTNAIKLFISLLRYIDGCYVEVINLCQQILFYTLFPETNEIELTCKIIKNYNATQRVDSVLLMLSILVLRERTDLLTIFAEINNKLIMFQSNSNLQPVLISRICLFQYSLAQALTRDQESPLFEVGLKILKENLNYFKFGQTILEQNTQQMYIILSERLNDQDQLINQLISVICESFLSIRFVESFELMKLLISKQGLKFITHTIVEECIEKKLQFHLDSFVTMGSDQSTWLLQIISILDLYLEHQPLQDTTIKMLIAVLQQPGLRGLCGEIIEIVALQIEQTKFVTFTEQQILNQLPLYTMNGDGMGPMFDYLNNIIRFDNQLFTEGSRQQIVLELIEKAILHVGSATKGDGLLLLQLFLQVGQLIIVDQIFEKILYFVLNLNLSSSSLTLRVQGVLCSALLFHANRCQRVLQVLGQMQGALEMFRSQMPRSNYGIKLFVLAACASIQDVQAFHQCVPNLSRLLKLQIDNENQKVRQHVQEEDGYVEIEGLLEKCKLDYTHSRGHNERIQVESGHQTYDELEFHLATQERMLYSPVKDMDEFATFSQAIFQKGLECDPQLLSYRRMRNEFGEEEPRRIIRARRRRVIQDDC